MTDLFNTDWRTLWGELASAEPVGAIYTRPEIVELILDLAEFIPERRRLAAMRVLEPGCGDGAFLTAVVRRILDSETLHRGRVNWNDETLTEALRAADISVSSVESARSQVRQLLREKGCPATRARRLAETWVRHTDFLLEDWRERFGLVVGNPPYVRIEALPREILYAYRAHFETLTDRADLYVAFIQRGLELLAPDGQLAYICANRFAKNQYGAALRQLVTSQYGVKLYLNLEHTQPFISDVSAYPAIIVISRRPVDATLSATLSDLEPRTLRRVREEALGRVRKTRVMERFESWYPRGAPWIATSRSAHAALETLAGSLPVIEDSAPGTRVGIGVATGADNVFILKEKHPVIEGSRQLPMAMPRDARAPFVTWSGRYVINPFADDDSGTVVNLDEYPGLRAYFLEHAEQLRGRHVAKREANWYRTIDRIWPQLAKTPKLLIPDIQPGGVVALESGNLYPHHNLYFVVSSEWPLPALQALLRSSAVLRQVAANSVQMRGGNVRYQAQVLRRVRIPPLRLLSPAMVDSLARIGSAESQAEVDVVADEVFAQALAPKRSTQLRSRTRETRRVPD